MSVTQVFDILIRENNDSGSSFDEHDFEELHNLSAGELEGLIEEIDCATRQGAQAAERAGGGSRVIDELLVSRVDWKQELRDLTKSIYKGGDLAAWNRPSKRFAYSGIMLPSRVALRYSPLVVALDTSPSISRDVVQVFMSELVSIAQELEPERVDMLVWGSTVVQHVVYEHGQYEQISDLQEIKDSPGTDPNCVAAYINAERLKPEATIVLTDGLFGDVTHDWPCEVIWCVVGNRGFVPPVGRSIHITL
jgi:predicted metal-dependent peptidase